MLYRRCEIIRAKGGKQSFFGCFHIYDNMVSFCTQYDLLERISVNMKLMKKALNVWPQILQVENLDNEKL